MATQTQWKLRRLADRALRIVQRRKGESPAIAAFEQTLVASARAFIGAYDRAQRTAGHPAGGPRRGPGLGAPTADDFLLRGGGMPAGRLSS